MYHWRDMARQSCAEQLFWSVILLHPSPRVLQLVRPAYEFTALRLTLCCLGPLQQVRGRCSSKSTAELSGCEQYLWLLVLNLNPDCVVELLVHYSFPSLTSTVNGPMQIMSKHLQTAGHKAFRTNGGDRGELVPEFLVILFIFFGPSYSLSCV